MSPCRPIRIGNCSGAIPDPGDIMLTQATAGPLDVITGDYLAEANLASYAEAHATGTHPGWVPSAWDGLQKSLGAINERRIRIVINGGAMNPKGLALETAKLVREKGYDLKVAWVDGDDLMGTVREILKPDGRGRLPHLDGHNEAVQLAHGTENFLEDPNKKIVAANAYLGCRGIRRGLDEGADIIICGRVADASPVMGAAAWWHGWRDEQFDELAGALVAGHLIECSTYGTGANFAGFDEYDTKALLNLGCPIAEIDAKGDCVITKHERLNGYVTEEVVKCQLLYELQGTTYLNSDVKADIKDVTVQQVGPNRVHVTGTKGHAPPPTTKLAVFYKGGYQGEMTINATGYATELKYDLQEAQVRSKLEEWGIMKKIDLLEFQRVGVPELNPRSQLAATSYLRIFVQAAQADTIRAVLYGITYNFMQHFPGLNCSLDWRLMDPLPYLGFFPALVKQDQIHEAANLIEGGGASARRCEVGPPARTEELSPRDDYDPVSPRDLRDFGPTRSVPFGDVALARSGDKGANVNVGFTPRAHLNNPEVWEWMRSFLTKARIKKMMGDDWEDWFHVERVEFPGIRAVHFVVYGALGRGVSSSARLDSLGKGFAEFLRFVHVPVPTKFLLRNATTSKL
ncbi:hypothetical protein JX265_005760 [Neoarthrinium moseri]|uniref:DUF1446-domain-containing protein n=1 Tax=Neoarthrinium moseri TaxID=1658444 RepID=A0A9P9WNA7_9PEZI|nr:uncharacterized protein JN550_012288 [Neoarthrinium moseri]KAI1858930.1 hypothetical protein JN550_012288 [Neoarthrinium moseri]KAI1871774.1 hypothetical protein JX265_005760 [Neoarthrinium moseri]